MRFGTKYGFGQSLKAGPDLKVVRIKFHQRKNRKKGALFCFSARYIKYGTDGTEKDRLRYWTQSIWRASSAQEAHRISTAIELKERIKSEIKAR